MGQSSCKDQIPGRIRRLGGGRRPKAKAEPGLLIASTTTRTGLTVQCRLDENTYEAGTEVSDAGRTSLNITPAEFHGEWNYTIVPRTHVT